MAERIDQGQALTLIEQAIRELDGEYQTGVREVHAWLVERGVDLPFDEVKGNMEIVRRLMPEEEE